MKPLVFAGNWKMHHGPVQAGAFLEAWLPTWTPAPGRAAWLFPPAAALETVARAVAGREGIAVGAQHVHWEAAGAFTGEMSCAIAQEAGATLALVGHSERRHVFGETDAECALKVRAILTAGLTPVLCVGETLAEREADRTITVVRRQLGALDDLPANDLARVVVAYEPVWAIGTGRTATPDDADTVQSAIRADLAGRGADGPSRTILYGGSVKPANVSSLIACPHVDGVLVGGASLDAAQWTAITGATPD